MGRIAPKFIKAEPTWYFTHEVEWITERANPVKAGDAKLQGLRLI